MPPSLPRDADERLSLEALSPVYDVRRREVAMRALQAGLGAPRILVVRFVAAARRPGTKLEQSFDASLSVDSPPSSYRFNVYLFSPWFAALPAAMKSLRRPDLYVVYAAKASAWLLRGPDASGGLRLDIEGLVLDKLAGLFAAVVFDDGRVLRTQPSCDAPYPLLPDPALIRGDRVAAAGPLGAAPACMIGRDEAGPVWLRLGRGSVLSTRHAVVATVFRRPSERTLGCLWDVAAGRPAGPLVATAGPPDPAGVRAFSRVSMWFGAVALGDIREPMGLLPTPPLGEVCGLHPDLEALAGDFTGLESRAVNVCEPDLKGPARPSVS